MVSDQSAAVEALCRHAFGEGAVTIETLDDVNRGRGAFSVVLRAGLRWNDRGQTDDGASERPQSVVAKLPVPGANGEAARTSGAYRREALAYREVLPHSPIAHPRAWAVVDGSTGAADLGLAEGAVALLIEDLSDHRLADQLDGLDRADALAVARALAHFHQAWDGPAELLGSSVRRNTLAGLDPGALQAGLVAIEERWPAVLGRAERGAFTALVGARAGLIERFDAAPATLCHGDPRADNLAFHRHTDHPILFDWQQMAVQFGEADLAWLAATSLTAETRRQIEEELVEAAGGRFDRYRLGLALPGLAVLLLAQRELPSERAERFVAVSLERIAAAITDNETAELG